MFEVGLFFIANSNLTIDVTAVTEVMQPEFKSVYRPSLSRVYIGLPQKVHFLVVNHR